LGLDSRAPCRYITPHEVQEANRRDDGSSADAVLAVRALLDPAQGGEAASLSSLRFSVLGQGAHAMKRVPFREIMGNLLLAQELQIEEESDKALRVRLQRLFRWATTTSHGEAAMEVADILEGRNGKKAKRRGKR
jgi:hypothetical protein